MSAGALVATLKLPFECLRTCHEGASDVRLYRNELTGAYRIGKRTSALGHELSVALTEAKLLETLAHPNIVRVYEVATVSDTGYDDPKLRMFELTMPYFERGSVYDALVRGERFGVLEACECVERSLRGLAELHRRGILHRDVKAGNVFLTNDGSLLKVGDLGIAQFMDESGLTDGQTTPQLYTPPETFVAKKIGVTSDIYGVGLILHEMLNGPFPYATYSQTEYSSRLARGRRGPRNADLRMLPHVPPDLRRIVRKAIDPNPLKRYASALEMSDRLSAARLIDWAPVQGDDSCKTWEGSCVNHPDRRFRIVAELKKRAGWCLRAEKHVTRWQQFLPPLIGVSSHDGKEAMELFDQVVKQVAI